MIKIKSVKLKNFESHENSIIQFDPFFNCIVGKTNSGKTALYNALAFVFLNDWTPDYIRHGCKECSVEVDCYDFKIIRERGGSKNLLEIHDKDGVKKYNNFGNDYPEDIKKMFVSYLNDTQICFAPQDNNSFLIYESSSIKGDMINKLSQVNILNEINEKITEKIKKIDNTLESLYSEKLNYIKEYNKLKEILKIESAYEKYLKLIEKKDNLKLKVQKMRIIKNSIDKTRCIDEIKNSLNLIGDIDFDFWDLFLQKIELLYKIKDKINTIDNEMIKLRKNINEISDEINKNSEEMLKIIEKEGRCTFCGEKLNSNSIDYIFEGII